MPLYATPPGPLMRARCASLIYGFLRPERADGVIAHHAREAAQRYTDHVVVVVVDVEDAIAVVVVVDRVRDAVAVRIFVRVRAQRLAVESIGHAVTVVVGVAD